MHERVVSKTGKLSEVEDTYIANAVTADRGGAEPKTTRAKLLVAVCAIHEGGFVVSNGVQAVNLPDRTHSFDKIIARIGVDDGLKVFPVDTARRVAAGTFTLARRAAEILAEPDAAVVCMRWGGTGRGGAIDLHSARAKAKILDLIRPQH